jgi:hypothetical protein
MTRFVAVCSLQRGIIDPPEPLDDAGQYRATMQAESDDVKDMITLRRRATSGYRLERDPLYNSTRAKCA